MLTSAQIFKKDKRYLDNFGLEFIVGKREVVETQPHNFTPAGLVNTIIWWKGPSKLCSVDITSAAEEFAGFDFLVRFGSSQNEQKLFGHNNTWIKRT